MLFVLAGWVLFRSPGFATAGSILGSLVGMQGFAGTLQAGKLMVAAALVSALVPSAHEMKDAMVRPYPALAVVMAALAVVCVLEVGRGAPVSFIYFQF
jgi:hypothetical protein